MQKYKLNGCQYDIHDYTLLITHVIFLNESYVSSILHFDRGIV